MDEISAGIRAHELLENAVLQEAFKECERRFTREWKQADTPAHREIAWAKTQALDEVLRVLRTAIANGELAAAIADADTD